MAAGGAQASREVADQTDAVLVNVMGFVIYEAAGCGYLSSLSFNEVLVMLGEYTWFNHVQ